MSFPDLLDHRAEIHRPAVGPDDPLGAEVTVYTLTYSNVRCALWSIHAPVDDYGAGETPTGDTMLTFESTVEPQPRDVVVLTSGPEAPKKWRVTADRSPGRRFGRPAHHRELIARPFEGELIPASAFTVGFSIGFEA